MWDINLYNVVLEIYSNGVILLKHFLLRFSYFLVQCIMKKSMEYIVGH